MQQINKSIVKCLIIILMLNSEEVNAAIGEDLVDQEAIIDLKLSQGAPDSFIDRVFNIFNRDNPRGNILMYEYKKDVSYLVRLRVGVATVINLPENEKITFFSLGNHDAFKISFDEQIPNLLSILIAQNDIESNLVVKTDVGSVYNFFLSSRSLPEKEKPTFTVFVVKDQDQEEFVREKVLLKDLKSSNDYIKKVESLEKLNTSYKVSGDKEIAPLFVYDDGKWTYFDFGKNFVSDRLPNIYKVIDSYDAVVNTRTEKNLLIAQSLSLEGWSLKNGTKVVCVKPRKNLKEVYRDDRFK